jgi:hypothetical protein
MDPADGTSAEPIYLEETKRVTIVCPECHEIVKVQDIHAFLLSIHQRVCGELELVNGVEP